MLFNFHIYVNNFSLSNILRSRISHLIIFFISFIHLVSQDNPFFFHSISWMTIYIQSAILIWVPIMITVMQRNCVF